MEIDHLFLFIDPGGPQIAALERTGLVETYRRQHPGQGTANVCYCFDNLYLELLWVTDQQAVRSPPIRRTGLYERSRWAVDDTCPFGIAWRETPGGTRFGLPTWDFIPPYLPAGMTIPVSTDSDDPHQPFMFRSPGTSAPADWPADRRGDLQSRAGLGAVECITLAMPTSVPIAPGLRHLQERTILAIRQNDQPTAAASLAVRRSDGAGQVNITLPACTVP